MTRAPLVPILIAAMVTVSVPATRADEGIEIARPDTGFLAGSRTAIASFQKTVDTAPTVSPETAWDWIHEVLAMQGRAQVSLAEVHAPASLAGLVTQDQLHRDHLALLGRIARRAGESAVSPVDEDAAAEFATAMSQVPELGARPLAFMVVASVRMASDIAQKLVRERKIDRTQASRLLLSHTAEASGTYETSTGDVFHENQTSEIVNAAVVTRLRCPHDGGTYRLNNMKSKLHADGSISRLHLLECTICHRPRSIAFPLPLASRLLQMSEKQKIRSGSTPARPQPGLDP